MKWIKFSLFILLMGVMASCSTNDDDNAYFDNPNINLDVPLGFPDFNPSVESNFPTKYGVLLGKSLFEDKRLSKDNSVSCATCHQQAHAYGDQLKIGVGIEERTGLRNVPPLQNLVFLRHYNWDGSQSSLESQVLVPLLTPEEMGSSIVLVKNKLQALPEYREMFAKAFGDEEVTSGRIFKSLAQYEYTLVSANSKYDRVQVGEDVFTPVEQHGYEIFQQKCAQCHSGPLFTDESYRNIGFPQNPNPDEAGRGRITGQSEDYMAFRVPSLRNIEYTAPYGDFGQFETLREVLDYFDEGVLEFTNLDSLLKNNGNRIPLSETEKEALIDFMKTLSDPEFVGG